MSNNHTPEMIAAAKVGDPCLILDQQFDYKCTPCKIGKITPSGQIVVIPDQFPTETHRFQRRRSGLWLQSVGDKFNDTNYLELNVAAALEQRATVQRSKAAANALNAVGADAERIQYGWGKASMQEHLAKLEAQVAAARIAVEAI